MKMTGPIGFVGIGIMGKGMLKNLVTKMDSASFVVWNRNTAVTDELKTLYPGKIDVALTAADVIKACDTTFSMLSTPEASAAVFDGAGGVIDAVTPGKLIVDCATLSPERMIDQDKRIKAKGGRFLEAPVSGSKGPADTGTLIFLCGGEETDFNEVAPALDAMGKAKYLFGPVGQGTRVKLVVNMMLGTVMGAFAEGMALGKAADIPLDKLLEVLDLGALSNPMFRLKGPKIAADDHTPNFPLKHQQKDLKLAIDLGTEFGKKLPITEAANDVFVKTMEKLPDSADEDFSAVYKQY